MKTDSADFCAQGKLTGPYHRNLWTNINLITPICYEGKYKHPDSGSLSREQRILNQRDTKFLNIALFKPCCPLLNKREIYFRNCPWNKKHFSVANINHAEASDPSCLSWVIPLATLISISSLEAGDLVHSSFCRCGVCRHHQWDESWAKLGDICILCWRSLWKHKFDQATIQLGAE